MIPRTCQSPLTWETLVAYWLGELDPDVEAQAEEHYLGCEPCSRRLAELAALADGVRTLARSSGVDMIMSEQFVHRLRLEGLRVREYRVPRNGSVNCTATPEDDFVVGRLEAPLKGVQRLDILTLDDRGNIQGRQEDIPFIADSGAVVLCPGIDTLRASPAFILHFRLLAVDERGGERALGDYTFNHTPYTSQHSR